MTTPVCVTIAVFVILHLFYTDITSRKNSKYISIINHTFKFRSYNTGTFYKEILEVYIECKNHAHKPCRSFKVRVNITDEDQSSYSKIYVINKTFIEKEMDGSEYVLSAGQTNNFSFFLEHDLQKKIISLNVSAIKANFDITP